MGTSVFVYYCFSFLFLFFSFFLGGGGLGNGWMRLESCKSEKMTKVNTYQCHMKISVQLEQRVYCSE